MKWMILGSMFLSSNLALANSQDLSLFWGQWVNHQQMTCLNGQEPLVKPDVKLDIELKEASDTANGPIKILVQKQVKAFSCLRPELFKDSTIIKVKYLFELNTSPKSEEELREIQTLLSEEDRDFQDFDFVMSGAEKDPVDFDLSPLTMFACNPMMLLNSPISFPEYFYTELGRKYLIKIEDSAIELHFKEEMICPKDVTVMKFKKL